VTSRIDEFGVELGEAVFVVEVCAPGGADPPPVLDDRPEVVPVAVVEAGEAEGDDEVGAALDKVTLLSPTPTFSGTTGVVLLIAFWYQLLVTSADMSGIVMGFHPAAFRSGHEYMNAATELSDSSCSRITRPGDLGIA